MQEKLREANQVAPNGIVVVGALLSSTRSDRVPASEIEAYVGINFFRPAVEGDTDIIDGHARTQLSLTVEGAWALQQVLNELLEKPVCTCGGTMIEAGPGRSPHTHLCCTKCEREVPLP